MELSHANTVLLLVFLVAALYSSVGHGGASGYLAVLSFFAVAPVTMATTALLLNILVAGIALWAFTRAGHFSLRLTWPFIVASVPAALLGGLTPVSDSTYSLLLALALAAAALRLALGASRRSDGERQRPLSLAAALPTGGAIGFLSGIVGIGGGVFLSPIILLLRWADAHRTSATAAAFIVINSMAGLAGRAARGGFEIGPCLPLVVAAALGGLLGAHLGASVFTGRTLRQLLAAVLLVAAAKLVYIAL